MSRWTVTGPQVLELDPVHVVRVRAVAGIVDVVGTDGPARLEVSAVDGPPLEIRHDPASGELDAGYEDLSWKNPKTWLSRDVPGRSCALSLAVPWDCTIDVAVMSAHATVSGMHGNVTVRSVAGGITLLGLTGAVDAATVAGAVEAESLAGDFQVATVSGDLTLVEGTGGRVRAHSVTGAMVMDLDAFGRNDVHLSTVSGALTVRLPHDGDVEVDVHSSGGTVGSAFDGLTPRSGFGTSRLVGTLGGGTGRLKIHSVSGDVALLRRAPEGKVSA
ncbi:DUF4097 family beta strand repeat-containing protein [Yinghuangia soli]|uniref:DUF4097 domain-containing protein n=1 Tax=Yinghuangia soli TaxID=2908204 RepID=A0AA41U6U3_9ACTN|nr:DUF4097 family beta strand repeat-containing protein [Yinghuangia soli]MCF2533372.1 DUF4097 domain-containing protein [Yinghuangia soli]